MSMEPTERELDEMVSAEIEHAEIEARKTPQEKLADNLAILSSLLDKQQRIMANIYNIVEKLGKI